MDIQIDWQREMGSQVRLRIKELEVQLKLNRWWRKLTLNVSIAQVHKALRYRVPYNYQAGRGPMPTVIQKKNFRISVGCK